MTALAAIPLSYDPALAGTRGRRFWGTVREGPVMTIVSRGGAVGRAGLR